MAAKSDVVAPGLFRDRREAGRLLATKLSAFLTIINDLMGGSWSDETVSIQPRTTVAASKVRRTASQAERTVATLDDCRPAERACSPLIPATKRSAIVLNAMIGRTVDFCFRHARVVIGLALVLGTVAAGYGARHFAVNTDISRLIARDPPWRQRQLAFQQAFPDRTESILAVVRAPTPELASAARDKLLDELQPKSDLFRSVHAPDGGTFFERNFLIYLTFASAVPT
jgi:hypothetical protein